MTRRRLPDFGRILKWRDLHRWEQATTYAGRTWMLSYVRRRDAVPDGPPEGWSLDLATDPYGREWFRVGGTIGVARYVAELRMTCPWVQWMSAGVAPDFIPTLLAGRSWDTRLGVVRVGPGRAATGRTSVGIRLGQLELPTVRPVFDVPADPAVDRVAVRWAVDWHGLAVAEVDTWDEAFAAAVAAAGG